MRRIWSKRWRNKNFLAGSRLLQFGLDIASLVMENGIITKGSERGEQETEETVLRPFSVGSLPSIYYIPDFVSPAEQNHLLHQVGVELFNPVFLFLHGNLSLGLGNRVSNYPWMIMWSQNQNLFVKTCFRLLFNTLKEDDRSGKVLVLHTQPSGFKSDPCSRTLEEVAQGWLWILRLGF